MGRVGGNQADFGAGRIAIQLLWTLGKKAFNLPNPRWQIENKFNPAS